MEGAPTPRRQLEELQRVRAIVEDRRRLPWWTHALTGTVVGSQSQFWSP